MNVSIQIHLNVSGYIIDAFIIISLKTSSKTLKIKYCLLSQIPEQNREGKRRRSRTPGSRLSKKERDKIKHPCEFCPMEVTRTSMRRHIRRWHKKQDNSPKRGRPKKTGSFLTRLDLDENFRKYCFMYRTTRRGKITFLNKEEESNENELM